MISCLFIFIRFLFQVTFLLKNLENLRGAIYLLFFPLPEESSSTKSSFSWISGTLLSDIPKIEVTSVLAWLFCKWNCECDCFKTLLARKQRWSEGLRCCRLVIIIIFDAFLKAHTVLATQIWIFRPVFFFIRESPTVVGLFNFTIIIIIIIADSSGNIICRSFISHSLHVAENLNRFGIW